MATFGERLKELRESKKLTQEELAKILNLSQSSIAYYESSKKPKQPSQRTLIKIAKYFNVTLDYLLSLTNDPNPPQSKKEKPNFEEYVLSASGLGEATIRIAELDTQYGMDDKTYTHLSRLAYNKFGLPGAKGSPKAAGGIKTPGTGALDEDTEKDDND